MLKKIAVALALVSFFSFENTKAQTDFCTSLNELVKLSAENFRSVKGTEKSRKRDIAGKEIVLFGSTFVVDGFEEIEIHNDYEWYWVGRFGQLRADYQDAQDDFKKLSGMVKGCLTGWNYKEMDKNPSDIYEFRGAFTQRGAESAIVNIYIQKLPKDKKFFTQLSVKGTKKAY
jgi:hypothetical protein